MTAARMTAAQYRSNFGTMTEAKPKRAPKYKNKRVEDYFAPPWGVQKFDSKAELARFRDLLMRERAGEITDLKRQAKYQFIVNGVVIGSAIFDFEWVERHRKVCADVKGYQNKADPVTRLFEYKCRLLLAIYNINVVVMK